MKKFVSVLSVMVMFGGFVAQGAVAADTVVLSGLVANDTDVCPWLKYTPTNLQPTCTGGVDTTCTQTGSGAGEKGICKKFNNGSVRCVARECKKGMLMPLVFETYDDMAQEQNARILGYCYTKAQAEQICNKDCAKGGKCEPNIVNYDEANKMLKRNPLVTMTGGQAFAGCVCTTCNLPRGTVCASGKCTYAGDIFLECTDGTTKSIKVTNFPVGAKDTPETISTRISEQYKGQAEAKCGGKTTVKSLTVGFESQGSAVGGASGSDNANSKKIGAARDRLAEFFKKVDSDRSVWKNADGSFNATRLASDLTAGVVLGTVGGVVSGVLIKKSQVEKGFDALNCTVNGQKIADWGDEFTVGLRR